MAASDAWKTWERKLCDILQRVAGRVVELGLAGIVTTTGRVGHLTSLGVDGFAGDHADGVALVIEAKRRKMPKWFLEAVAQVSEAGGTFGRYPVIGFSLASDFGRQQVIKNKDGSTKKIAGKAIALEKEWAAVPVDYLAELIAARRMLAHLMDDTPSLRAEFNKYLEGTI
jgi:hypothetical protein